MWYCPSCGSQNQGNARFCVECGKPRPEQPAAPQTTPPAGASAPVYGGAPVPPAKPKKKSKWWLWLLLALAVLAAAAAVCYFTVHVWEPATCTEPETCKICGKTQGAPLGHQSSGAADCENPETCTRCGAVITPALGHDLVPATCYDAAYCKRCGHVEGEPLGHDWQPATYDEPETCSRCGETRGEVRGWIGYLAGSINPNEDLYLYKDNESHPYVLNEPVHNCLRFTVYLSFTKVSGDPYGNWAVFGRDPGGEWNQLGTFYVDRSVCDEFGEFPIEIDGDYSFDALTLVALSDNTYTVSFSFYYDNAQAKD